MRVIKTPNWSIYSDTPRSPTSPDANEPSATSSNKHPPAWSPACSATAPPRTENLAVDAGTTWRHYAPGDHTRTRQPTPTP